MHCFALLSIASWSRKLSHATGCVAVLCTGKLRQIKSKLKGKLKGTVHCFAFDLPCWLERKADTGYGFICMVLLCFVCWKGAVTCHSLLCFALFAGDGICHTLRSALFCFTLFCSARARELSHVTICFPMRCSALLCIALLCIAHLWNDKEANQTNVIRHAESKHAKRMLKAC